MIDLGQALVMGVVQGLTEFLPVSSSGHLILVPALLGWSGEVTGLEFSVALHVGTLMALLLAFWRDWWRLGLSAVRGLAQRSLADADAKLAWLLVIGTIPGAIAGYFLEKPIENALRSPAAVGVAMVVVALVLLAADRLSPKARTERSMTVWDGLRVGLAQALALAPGVSRSGKIGRAHV